MTVASARGLERERERYRRPVVCGDEICRHNLEGDDTDMCHACMDAERRAGMSLLLVWRDAKVEENALARHRVLGREQLERVESGGTMRTVASGQAAVHQGRWRSMVSRVSGQVSMSSADALNCSTL